MPNVHFKIHGPHCRPGATLCLLQMTMGVYTCCGRDSHSLKKVQQLLLHRNRSSSWVAVLQRRVCFGKKLAKAAREMQQFLPQKPEGSHN